MSHRTHFLAALAVLLLVLGAAPASFALEKAAHRADIDEPGGDWRGGATTCSLAYYNTCTGWVWTWSGWDPGERYGVCYQACCAGGVNLLDGWAYVWSPAPSGYGFTGTLEVSAADANLCPTGAPLHTQPFLPGLDWNYFLFNSASVPATFVLAYVVPAAPYTDPHAIASDFPAAGAPGEQPACGTCYPTTRAARSFYYGTASSPVCPGQPFDDGTCDAELLWEVRMGCTVSVESATWGRIKSVFR